MQNGRHTRYVSRSGRERRRRRLARRRLLLVLVVAIAVAAGAAVIATRGRGGQGGPGREEGSGAASPRAAAAARSAPPEVWAATVADPVRIWVGGDSMAGELAWALEPILKDTRAFTPVMFFKESSGICRYDFFDWGAQIETVVRTTRPQAAVVMIGANDAQSVWTTGGWLPYGTPAWTRAYGRRVGDLIDALLAGGVRRVYWVGLPVMGESWRNGRMLVINGIFRAQAEERPGARYIESWSLFAMPDGSSDASLRLSDGVHFTVEGQTLLAEAVFAAIRADWLPAGSPASSGPPSPTPSASGAAP